MEFKVQFAEKKRTPGAVQYQEVNHLGTPLPQNSAQIGSLYIRKDAFARANTPIPSKLTVTVSMEA